MHFHSPQEGVAGDVGQPLGKLTSGAMCFQRNCASAKTELCSVLVSWSPSATAFQEAKSFLRENTELGKVSPNADSLLRIKIIVCFFLPTP